jgi:hypothetical protein
MIAREDFMPLTIRVLQPRWIQHELLRSVVQRLLHAHSQGAWRGLAEFITGCPDAREVELLSGAAAAPQKLHDAERMISDVLLRLRNASFDRELGLLKQQLARPDLSSSEQDDLQRRLSALRQAKQQPLEPSNREESKPEQSDQQLH